MEFVSFLWCYTRIKIDIFGPTRNGRNKQKSSRNGFFLSYKLWFSSEYTETLKSQKLKLQGFSICNFNFQV